MTADDPTVTSLEGAWPLFGLRIRSEHLVLRLPIDADLPDHDAATMKRLFSRSMPDWADRAAVAEFAAGGAEILGNDPAAARATAERIWDRTPGAEPTVQMANQMGVVFAKLNCKPRWRERLADLAMPTLVVRGENDPIAPAGWTRHLAGLPPRARFAEIRGGAHANNYSDAAAFAAVSVGAYGWIERQAVSRRTRFAVPYIAVQLALGYLLYIPAGAGKVTWMLHPHAPKPLIPQQNHKSYPRARQLR